MPNTTVKSPTPLSGNENHTTNYCMAADALPKVTMQHMNKAASVCLNSSNLSSASQLYDLNAHQKMVMAALIASRKRNSESTCDKASISHSWSFVFPLETQK